MYRTQKLTCPAMNVADSVVKSRFDNFYGPKEAIIDSLKERGGINVLPDCLPPAFFAPVIKGSS